MVLFQREVREWMSILAAVFEAHFSQAPWLGKMLWAGALFTAGMTAFYMFRLLFMTFFGDYHGAQVDSHGHGTHAHGHGNHGHGAPL